ncbi:arylacetamide deacetylase-like 2 [Grammomys surdaster]|uniref:arylacetamide deacetylase-like 2 n=1 Tax=Grammomys surdaster TaxID=491861 RepID=UPI0010A00642|nr:arylacetamide deacetylase-like 2 [Grammomys surdaster]
MRNKILCFGFFFMFLAYLIYVPIPENIEEPWKVRIVDAGMKISSLVAILLENMGLMKFEEFLVILARVQDTRPVSDENITVIDTDFGDIPVRLYLPKRKSQRQRPGIIFIHGGAYALGSFKMLPYDSMNRRTANKLDAVVIALDYRLAPQHPFPAALEDCIFVIKFFLQDKVLEKYGVDPTRICISGDSSGGSLAATANQLLQDDPEYKNKIKAQTLLYPKVQTLDTLTPSYREYEHGPFLSRKVAIRLACLYLTEDKQLPKTVMRNAHVPQESRHLFKFVNWSDFLPEKYKKNRVYTEPIIGKLTESHPGLMDSKISPLLVNDSQLQKLPLTYVLTCEHDILRDDGLIYVTRLRNVGVPITHDHIEDGIHGAILFATEPLYLQVGLRLIDKYIIWLKENL